jgi:hypothetical protein
MPTDRDQWETLHSYKWKKYPTRPWCTQLAAYIELWNNRFDQEVPQPIGVSDAEYMAWYTRRTVTMVNEVPPSPPPVEQLETAVMPPPHYDTHGNTSMLLVSNY